MVLRCRLFKEVSCQRIVLVYAVPVEIADAHPVLSISVAETRTQLEIVESRAVVFRNTLSRQVVASYVALSDRVPLICCLLAERYPVLLVLSDYIP